MDTALHGTWVGITSAERAMLAAALWVVNGGAWPGGESTAILPRLATQAQLDMARRWGLAMRLGQRLGGGAAEPLRAARLARAGTALELSLGPDAGALYGEPVMRRHRALAQALGLEAKLRLG
jgi:exopolyphosphatase/guanosine-5'-triphosphate,3'-diphosphate pyrophosphatase